MDKTALVEKDVDQGADMIRALDEAGFPVHSALWVYYSDQREWRLIVATPLVDEKGPLDTYKKLDKILRKKEFDPAMFLQDIQLVRPTVPLVQALSKVVKTGKDISSIRLSHNSINGIYIDEALIYRIQ